MESAFFFNSLSANVVHARHNVDATWSSCSAANRQVIKNGKFTTKRHNTLCI